MPKNEDKVILGDCKQNTAILRELCIQRGGTIVVSFEYSLWLWRPRNYSCIDYPWRGNGEEKGLYAVQTQSYGSEARGGQCQQN